MRKEVRVRGFLNLCSRDGEKKEKMEEVEAKSEGQ